MGYFDKKLFRRGLIKLEKGHAQTKSTINGTPEKFRHLRSITKTLKGI